MIDRRFIKDTFEHLGFQRIAIIHYKLTISLWWHPGYLIKISVTELAPYHMLKGIKSYYMKAYTEEAETYCRDLNHLQETLESHFPEIHISFSFFRDITQSSALGRIKDKRRTEFTYGQAEDLPGPHTTLSKLRSHFDSKREELHRTDGLQNMTASEPSLLRTYLKRKSNELRKELKDLQIKGNRLKNDLTITHQLLKQYMKKGCAACFIFSYSSNLQKASSPEEFQNALVGIIKEIQDAHRYQISQKLSGGKLNVFVEEVRHPDLVWQFECAGGVPNLRQLEKLGPEFDSLRERVEEHLMVTPSQDIVIGGSIKEAKKLLGAKVVQNFLTRLDKVPQRQPLFKDLPKEGGWLGQVIPGNEITNVPLLYPINLRNAYVSGTTRSGKSCLARALTENVLLEGDPELVLVILDPTRQWTGLAKPATDDNTLRRFERLGINANYRTGFDVKIYTPGSSAGLQLPHNIKNILNERSVVSMKELDDKERCRVARDILETIYNLSLPETEGVRVLVVIEEAHSFMPGNTLEDAKAVAKEVCALVNRISREKVKYGVNLLIITQSLSDFKRDARIVREMVNSRFFLRATDPAELEFVEHYVSKEAVQIVRSLREGEALVHGPLVPMTKVFVRPTFSAVRELSDEEIAQVSKEYSYAHQDSDEYRPAEAKVVTITEDEQVALKILREYRNRSGKPITAVEFGKLMNIHGGSRQRLLDRMESKGLISTITLPGDGGRGRPPKGILPLV